MEMWLSIVGFLVVVAIIVTIMTKKLSTMVALSVIPLVGGNSGRRSSGYTGLSDRRNQ